MADQNEPPKIQVDSDWKAQAQAEKQRLSEQATQPEAAGTEEGRGGPPKASFDTLVNTMATQAFFAMGLIPDPRSGQRVQHLELARHHIDMLGVIEEKTKGNLTDEEQKMLSSILYELRNNYITIGTAARGR